MPLKTADNNFGTAKWIVSSAYSDGCTHTTIASALTSASSGDTIAIRTGVYTENLTLKAGVNLVAYTVDGITPTVTIIGKLSFSSAGTVSISGIRLQTNSDNFLAVTGSAASIVNLYDCYLNMTNATGIAYSSSSGSSAINLYRCNGDIGTTGIAFYAHSSTGNLNCYHAFITNTGSSSTQSTLSAGSAQLFYSNISARFSSSGTGWFFSYYSVLNSNATNTTVLTIGGSPGALLAWSSFSSGNAVGITVTSSFNIKFSEIFSTNAVGISGSGTVSLNCIAWIGTATAITATLTNDQFMSVTKLILQNQIQVLSGAGSPNGVITAPKGSLYMRTDGSSTSTRAYTNTNSGTTWTAFTTAA